ncbi:unnamed protein product, partial [Prorocentrum cordatum]
MSGFDPPGALIPRHHGGEDPEIHSLDQEGEHHGNSLNEVHGWALHVVLPISACFLFALVLASQLHRLHVDCIPESAATVFVGICFGLLMEYGGVGNLDEELYGAINSTVLNLVLLPIIIFESGWSLRYKDFGSQLVYILIFAIAGTVISVLVVGFLIHVTSHWHHINSLRVAFAYASLISAVDPVATLATYSSLQVEPLLNIMVFGESVINDAVAIVLFHVLNDNQIFGEPEPMDEAHADDASQHIYDQLVHIHQAEAKTKTFQSISIGLASAVLELLFGSILLGCVLAITYVFVFRVFKMRESVTIQIMFIVVSCFLTYALAESIHMSGIIAVLFCAITMGIYARPHLTIEGAALASFVLKQAGMLADMAVFLFVGAAVTMIDTKGMLFSIIVMAACLVGRAMAVYPLGALVNCIKRCRVRGSGKSVNLLSSNHLFMMWHAGLRGGIAFVLCMELGDWVDVVDGKGTKLMLRTATFMTVCAFLLGLGGTTKRMLKRNGIRCGEQCHQDVLYKKEFAGSTRRCVESVHDSCLKPLLVGDLELKATMDSGVIGHVMMEAAQLQGRSMNDSGFDLSDTEELRRSRSQ